MSDFELTPAVPDITTEMQSITDAVRECNAAIIRWDDCRVVSDRDRPLIDGLGLLGQRLAALHERMRQEANPNPPARRTWGE